MDGGRKGAESARRFPRAGAAARQGRAGARGPRPWRASGERSSTSRSLAMRRSPLAPDRGAAVELVELRRAARRARISVPAARSSCSRAAEAPRLPLLGGLGLFYLG